MRALVYRGPFDLTVQDVPEPEPGPGHVVVEVLAAGICGSDVTAYAGRMGTAHPGDVRGHEFAGRVVRTAPADEAWLDRRVVVNPLVSCGSCGACSAGADNLCPQQATLGVQGPGGFAELVRVPVGQLVDVPPALSIVDAATTEPLAQAVHDVRLALRDGPARTALVIGAGAIGFFVVQAARLSGIPDVAVLEPDPDRRNAAAAAGAMQVFATAEEAQARLQADPSDVVLDCVGTEETRAQALAWTRRGGTVVLVGLHSDVTPLAWRDVIRREITLRGSMASTADDFRQAAQWLAEGRAGLPDLGEPVPLDDGPEVFAALAAGRWSGSKALLAARK